MATYFARRRGENEAAHLRRLRRAESAMGPGGAGYTIREIMRAVRMGATLPPVIVALLHNEYRLVDGWHRCAATAALGHTSVNAIVWAVKSNEEADALSEAAHTMSELELAA